MQSLKNRVGKVFTLRPLRVRFLQALVVTLMGLAFITQMSHAMDLNLAQSINGFNPPDRPVGSTITLTATATSGLPVSFSTSTPAICTVTGTQLSYDAVGTCTVSADQIGDPTFAPALTVTRSFDSFAGFPGAPTATLGGVTPTSISVNWNPPASDGGSPITSYTVTIYEALTCSGASSNSATGPNLRTLTMNVSAGADHAVNVRATTDAGTSDPSACLPSSGVSRVDNIAPTLTSITRYSPLDNPTSADVLTWRFTFSEPVQNVDPSDFAVFGGGAAALSVGPLNARPKGSGVSSFSATPPSDSTYIVTVSGGDIANLNGTVTVGLSGAVGAGKFARDGFVTKGGSIISNAAAIVGIQDTSGNNLVNTVPTGTNENSYQVVTDNTPPSITSITRAKPNVTPTDADTLSWFITFSESVVNVDVTDFTVSGVTGANLSVNPSKGATVEKSGPIVSQIGMVRGVPTYIVTVSGGNLADLDGRVTLGVVLGAAKFKSSGSVADGLTKQSGGVVQQGLMANGIQDVAGNSLDNAQPTGANDNFFDVQNSTADLIAPTITVSSGVTTVTGPFPVTFGFSEAVSDFTANDISIANGTVSDFTGNGSTYTATITPVESGDVTISVAAAVAEDAAANQNEASNVLVVKNDQTPPSVVIAGVPTLFTGPFTASFTFSEDVTGFDATDIGVTNAGLSEFTGSGASFTALITPSDTGNITLSIPAAAAQDIVGNDSLASNIATASNDGTAPVVVSITRQDPSENPTGADSVTWRVSFSEAVINVDAADFVVTGADLNVSVTGQDTQTFDVSASGDALSDLNGTLTLSFASAQDITDSVGNALSSTAPTGANDNTFDIENDTTPPTLTISGVPDPISGPFTATFTFSEDVTGFEEDDIIVTNGTVSNFTSGGGAAKVANKNGASPAQSTGASIYTALITPEGVGSLTITVSDKTLSDVAGNVNTAATTVATVIDSTAPNVVLSGVSESVRGAFDLTVTFDEDMTGFTASDVALTNATATASTATSASVYVVTIQPTTQGLVTMKIDPNVATDAAGNGNTASNEITTDFIDETFIRTRTQRIINNFMVRRADQLTINDPDMAQRLLSESTGGQLNGHAESGYTQLAFNGSANGETANLGKLIGADAASKLNMWTQASLVSVSNNSADNDLFLLYAGVDYRVNDDTVVGVMGQYDSMDETDKVEAYDISGKGWMIGPYIVSRLTDALIFEGRGAVGGSTNDVSPLGTYEDEFKTSRWLLKGQFTGDFTANDWRINPNISVIYFEDKQKAYTDNLGINISGQTVKLGRVAFGPRFSKTLETSGETKITPQFGVRGIWDFERTDIVDLTSGFAAGTNKFRARTEAGLVATLSGGVQIKLEGFYDGIGASNYEAYGSTLGVTFPLG